MKNKKLLVLSVLLVFALIQPGCSSGSSYKESLYDNAEQIIAQGDKFSYVSRISTVDEKHTIKFGTFYGMDTIYEIYSEGNGKVNIEYNSEVNKGKFKCILIAPDNEILTIFEGDGDGTVELDMKKGKSRIKLVGYEAGGESTMLIKGEGDAIVKKSE